MASEEHWERDAVFRKLKSKAENKVSYSPHGVLESLSCAVWRHGCLRMDGVRSPLYAE